jgi:thioredoxin reductase (NADPH)
LWLGIPAEETFRGFGVSACATCDGFFFRDKRVAVVGGGNTAVEEALYLASIANCVHRTTGSLERLEIDGVFIAIGHATASVLLEGKVELHADGYVKVKPAPRRRACRDCSRAGDVADGVYRQPVTAAGLGCMELAGSPITADPAALVPSAGLCACFRGIHTAGLRLEFDVPDCRSKTET